MENNESNMKPQQTGGLKLMTVFVVVLALHVVVIGGMTTYYLLKGGSADSELVTDKTHKGLKANPDGTLAIDGQMPDSTDKSGTASTAATPAPDASAGTAASTSTPTPAPDQTASSDASSATPTPVVETPAPVVTTPTPVTTPSSTPATTTPAIVTTSSLNPGAETTPPVQNGPVITPPASLAPPPDVTQITPAIAGTPYVVKSHDSFAKIAHKNHVSVTDLMAANSLTSNKLSIGQKLIIPAKTPAATASTTVPAMVPAVTDVATTAVPTTPVSISTPVSAPVKEKKAKSVATAKTSTTLTKGTLDHHLYTIVKGDTLTKIAHKFKTTPAALMTANNITDPTKLGIGKKLVIPSKETHTAKVNEPATEPAKAKASAAQLANNVQ